MHRENGIKEILQRYLEGECTAQEARWLEQWYELIEKGEDTNLSGNNTALLDNDDEERLVKAWRLAVAARQMSEQPTEKGRVIPIRFRKVMLYAAAWTGIIVFGGMAIFQWHKWYQGQQVRQMASFLEISTGYGQVRKVLLPDSSVVWLNSATHLQYHADFIRHRELQLTGEAFFEVKPDVQHPFIVRSNNASTRVFGTAFNISAYEGTGQLRISLQSGKVGVTYDGVSGSKDHVLTPGQLLIYDNVAKVARLETQTPGEMDVWKAGSLLFYKTPLREAMAQIEARYGVHVVCDAAVNNQTITAKFENAALEKVLEHLAFGWDLHFSRQGNTLYVR